MSASIGDGDPPGTDVLARWDVRVPLRDGISLSAAMYMPSGRTTSSPCLVALTPYTVQRNHLRARYFAAHGYPFLVVDVRGRGNSEGTFRPFIQEACDGYDVVEWLGRQPFCNGQVAMFSGSYEGYVQWATAKEFPQHLATIVPGMAAAPGIDFPMCNNISRPYLMQWLTYVTGHTAQDNVFSDQSYWRARFREWYESGLPLKELDAMVGNPSAIFQEWLSHPDLDQYWDATRPTAEDFARIDLPILTLTGSYDVDQAGALYYYREHMRRASASAAARHYLVIGPWDHRSTLAPNAESAGVRLGPAALLDVLKLHIEWYDWVLRGGSKPVFLRSNVAYYVMGAEKWRYADTLDAATARCEALYLYSISNPTDVLHSGLLRREPSERAEPDQYVYDPRDITLARLESTIDPESRVEQRLIYAATGKRLVYHSAPLEVEVEITGFFRLLVWLSIDQPDTDFCASVYEICLDGTAIQLSTDSMRARYRESPRAPTLVQTTAPLRYDFEHFTFVSRRVRQGHRLRLVLGPVNSIYSQKNYNSGGVVSQESMRDARAVTVQLFHDEHHPSALYVPFGQPET